MAWMHDDKPYSFHGDAPIAGLTPAEIDVLNLGYMVRQEQQDQQAENARRGRKYTDPAQTTQEAMNTFTDRVSG